ncbi:MAG: helix-turn-helix domain-containing protein [Nitrospirota bacterium]
MSFSVSGQKGRVLLFCHPMNDSELKKMMGSNLRKLRLESRMTQEQLAERLHVSGGLIPKWESGAKGIGKKVLVKLCVVFNVRPYMFCRDELIPLITNPREQEMVYTIREAERLGVCEQIEQYCTFIISQAMNKQQTDIHRPTSLDSSCDRPGKDVFADANDREIAAGLSLQDRHGITGGGKVYKRRRSDISAGKKE